jgi:hypothetical protein
VNNDDKRIEALQADNARMREALAAIKRHQEIAAGPRIIPGMSVTHKIAVDALDGLSTPAPAGESWPRLNEDAITLVQGLNTTVETLCADNARLAKANENLRSAMKNGIVKAVELELAEDSLSTKPEGESVTPAPAGVVVTLETCEWTQMDSWDFSDSWDTGCGHSFSFGDGGPGEDWINYCCYCGKKIVPVKAKEFGEEGEDDTAAIRDAEVKP